MDAPPVELSCSFCGKRQSEVHKLVAGPTAYICDECIDLCLMIVSDGEWHLRAAYWMYVAVAKLGYYAGRVFHPRRK